MLKIIDVQACVLGPFNLFFSLETVWFSKGQNTKRLNVRPKIPVCLNNLFYVVVKQTLRTLYTTSYVIVK